MPKHHLERAIAQVEGGWLANQGIHLTAHGTRSGDEVGRRATPNQKTFISAPHMRSRSQQDTEAFSWPFLLCFGIPTYEITNRDTHARSTEYDLLLAEYLRRNYSANSYGGAGSVAVAACDSHVLFDAGRIRCSSQQQGMCGKPACTRGIRIWLRAPGHPLLKPER